MAVRNIVFDLGNVLINFNPKEYTNNEKLLKEVFARPEWLMLDRGTLTYEEAKEIFIMGGGQIYKQFMENGLTDRLLITKVNESFEADTYFPQIDDSWKIKERVIEFDNDFETEFIVYERG